MASRDITDQVRNLAGIDGTVPSLSFQPEETNDSRLTKGVTLHFDGDTLTVGYLTRYDDPGDFWEDDDGAGDFRPFKRGDDPEEILASITAEGKIPLLVQRYSHGLDHYSVASSRAYPDHQWDVGICGVMTPCEDVQEAYRKTLAEAGPEAAVQKMVEDSNKVLDEYSKHCNGDVYGVVLETWKVEGQHVRAIDNESVWGFIGSEYALEELFEQMPERESELEIDF